MNGIEIFNNSQFGTIRTLQENGKILFCGSDVAKALGYVNTKDALNKHCRKDGVAFRDLIDSKGRTQQAKFIDEGNLYRLICNSKLPGAEKFESVTQKHSDLFNSMKALGTADGKLYFRGMWYDAEKERYNGGAGTLFSAVNSGYYTIDMQTGELAKLYPYISGETFFGPDGNLYCISGRTRIPRIVNLNTGKIIPIE